MEKLILNNFKRRLYMVLVLFICTILIVVMLFIITVLLSTIKIQLKNFNISNLKIKKTNYKLIISLSFLNKFKWLSFKLNKQKLHKISLKMHLDRIDIKKLEKDFKISDIKELLKIKPRLTFMNLELQVGLEDIILTTYMIPSICTILSVVLPLVTEKNDIKNIKYIVEPIYNQKNLYYIKLNSNLEIKMLNLLNSMYSIYKNRKKDVPNKNNYRNINIQKNNVKCNV